MDTTRIQLARKLIEVKYQDGLAAETGNEVHYDNRTMLMYEAMALAKRCGLSAGVRIDPEEPEWPVAFIELPTGQISYHLEQHKSAWDNHTTDEKNLRILEWITLVSVANSISSVI